MAHTHNIRGLRHHHSYLSGHEQQSERRTIYVALITAGMMVIEIVCGIMFGSMALLADGWHMFTHAGALGIAALAYLMARKHAKNPRYSFGTGKINALGGYTSAIILLFVALWMVGESCLRLQAPHPINYDEAILIAVIGLIVNILSASLLKTDHHHHDHNLKAAYMHVLADAFTSILAIAALLGGKYWGWGWLDPLMGVLGGIIIAQWSIKLLRTAGTTLLDRTPDIELEADIRRTIEDDRDNKVTDLHLWHIAPGKLSAIISLVTDKPQPPKYYKSLLRSFSQLVHVTVEVNKCESR